MPEITLKLVKGQNLISCDRNGYSDPYCCEKKATSKIQKKTLDPEWGEEFKIEVEPHDVVTLLFWDKDKWSADDKIGFSRFEVRSTSDGEHFLPVNTQGRVEVELDAINDREPKHKKQWVGKYYLKSREQDESLKIDLNHDDWDVLMDGNRVEGNSWKVKKNSVELIRDHEVLYTIKENGYMFQLYDKKGHKKKEACLYIDFVPKYVREEDEYDYDDVEKL